VAIGLLGVFILAVAVMFLLRRDPNWDRLVYVFGGLEAIVFAGVGALFGTTVQRGTVAAARAESEQARVDARHAQQELQTTTAAAANGRALAAVVKKAAGAEPASLPEQSGDERRAGRPDADLSGGSQDSWPDPRIATLAQVAAALFPD